MSAISTYDENYILGTHVVRNDQISWESESDLNTAWIFPLILLLLRVILGTA